MKHYEHLHRITDAISIICSFFQRQRQFSTLYHKFLSPSQGQFFGSWFSSWCSRGITGEVHKSQEYNLPFPKRNIRNQKLKETLGLFLQFLWQRVQETSAISIALPPHLSLALPIVQIQQLPKLFSKVNSVEMMNQKNPVERRNYVPFWSHKGTREKQYRVLVTTLVTNAADTCHLRTQLLPCLWLRQTGD